VRARGEREEAARRARDDGRVGARVGHRDRHAREPISSAHCAWTQYSRYWLPHVDSESPTM
jgi:hypothetical protein